MIAIGNEALLFDVKYIFGQKLKLTYYIENDINAIIRQIPLFGNDVIVCFQDETEFELRAKLRNLTRVQDYLLVSDLAKTLDKVYLPQYNNRASALFLTVYKAPHGIYKPCYRALYNAQVDKNGDVYICCSALQHFSVGNICENNLSKIWKSFWVKILHLSAINGTLCLCKKGTCQYQQEEKEIFVYKEKTSMSLPQHLNIAIDDSCNLSCRFCRTSLYTCNESEKLKRLKLIDRLLPEITNIPYLYFAGNGEVFFSEIYKSFLLSKSERLCQILTLVTNGILYSDEDLIKIAERCDNLRVYVSIDAASVQTYNFLRRNPNFEILLKNLSKMNELRKQGIIRELVFRFVVQKANYLEMPEFIALGKKYGADRVEFTRLVKSDTEYLSEYESISLLTADGKLKGQYHSWFSNVIFKDDYVNIDKAFINEEWENE